MKNVEKLEKKIVKELKKYGVKKISLFGSFVKNQKCSFNDIDIIVEFLDRKSLLDIVKVERKLADSLGIKVDLLTEKFISPHILKSIKRDLKVIYGR